MKSAVAEGSRRSEFSIPSGEHYLNCAYFAPLSNRVVAAGQSALQRLTNPSAIEARDFFEPVDDLRRAFARIIGADDYMQIAVLPSVSYGMATIARNVAARPGSEVLLVEDQFPSDVYVWRRLARDQGIKLRTVPRPATTGSGAKSWTDTIVDSISRNTAVVCVPTVHWTDGTRLDLQEIGATARSSGALFVVDGSQSVGALPIDVVELKPDALICAGYKWLMGPYGMSLGYFGTRLIDGVPLEETWLARRGSREFASLIDYQDRYLPGAIRFDVGQRANFIHVPMLLEALRQVIEREPGRIQQFCQSLCSPYIPKLAGLGFGITEEGFRCGHIWGVRLPRQLSPDQVKSHLDRRHVRVSLRGDTIRISPNVYNEEDDLAALLEALESCRE